MIHPLEKKRATYLTAFEEGVSDAFQKGNMNESKRSSAYYRRGYEFGITLKERLRNYSMKCDYCDHIEYYEDENSFFQGEMFGLNDDTVSCPNCLEKQPNSKITEERLNES